MDTDGGLHTRLVAYEVTNPEWTRLNGILASAEGPADTLSHVLDRTRLSFEGALCSSAGDQVGVELTGWSQSAQRAAELAIEELQSAVAATPKTVTKYYWQYVPDSGY